MTANLARICLVTALLPCASALANPTATAGGAWVGDSPAPPPPTPSYPVDPSIFAGTGVDPTFHVPPIDWSACASCAWTAAQAGISISTDTEPVFIGRVMNDGGAAMNNCYNCIESLPAGQVDVTPPVYDPTSVTPLVPSPSMEWTPDYPYPVDVGNDD